MCIQYYSADTGEGKIFVFSASAKRELGKHFELTEANLI